MPLLPDIPSFNNLTESGKEALSRVLVRKTIPSGTQLLYKGSRISGAYVVHRGRLRVYSISPSGTEATLYSIEQGETCVFAINSVFQDLLYPAWVEAETECEVGIIPGSLFRKLFSSESSIQSMTLQALSTAVFQLMAELEQMHFSDVKHRLIHLILSKADSKGVLSLTQHEIALHLGTSREVVSRLLKKLAIEETIRVKRGATVILDSSRLSGFLISREAN